MNSDNVPRLTRIETDGSQARQPAIEEAEWEDAGEPIPPPRKPTWWEQTPTAVQILIVTALVLLCVGSCAVLMDSSAAGGGAQITPPDAAPQTVQTDSIGFAEQAAAEASMAAVEASAAADEAKQAALVNSPMVLALFVNPSATGPEFSLDTASNDAGTVCHGKRIWTFEGDPHSDTTGFFAITGDGLPTVTGGSFNFDGETLSLFDVKRANVVQTADGDVDFASPVLVPDTSYQMGKAADNRIRIGSLNYRLCATG